MIVEVDAGQPAMGGEREQLLAQRSQQRLPPGTHCGSAFGARRRRHVSDYPPRARDRPRRPGCIATASPNDSSATQRIEGIRWLRLHSAPVAARYDFEGRTALITGGAGDIGAAVARRLLSSGANVATLDIRAAELDGVLALTGDVTRADDVDGAIGLVEAELGPLDIAVCAAGVAGESLRTVDVSDDEWRQVFAINCDGVFFTNRAAARAMVPRGRGRIVNVASVAGKEGNPMAAAYSASKAAVIAMTKSIGKDLAETGVLVNCIAPAVIQTRMLGDLSEEHIQYMVERIPMKRIGQPDEAAALIAFLASEECSFSTGATFDLSGGRATY